MATDQDNRTLAAVLGQIDWWWDGIFRHRLAGLTDEEFWWEPVADCWTLRPTGDGRVVYEHAWPPPTPAPFTTVAWRLCHICVGCLQARTVRYSPAAAGSDVPVSLWDEILDFPDDAAAALAFVDHWWSAWRQALDDLDDIALQEPIGDREHDASAMRLGVGDPLVNMILHNHRELMHHGAEICLLRDLFVASRPQHPFVVACLRGNTDEVARMLDEDATLAGRMRAEQPDLLLRTVERRHTDVVARLARAGFPVDPGGTLFPLHRAAAGDDLATVRLLIDLGADVDARDQQWNATALGWAEQLGRQSVVDYLKPLSASPPPRDPAM